MAKLKRMLALLLAMSMLTGMLGTVAFAREDDVDKARNVTNAEELVQATIDSDPGGIIRLVGDITLTSRLEINKQLTIIGTENAQTGKYSSITAGESVAGEAIRITADSVELKNLIIVDESGKVGDNALHGIQVYGAKFVQLERLTINDFGKDALLVNGGAYVDVDFMTTSGNEWGAINVDHGSQLDIDSIENLEENVQVWSEDSNCTINVYLDRTSVVGVGEHLKGYTYYTTDMSKLGVATITSNGVTTVYETLQGAVDNAQSGETIMLLEDVTATSAVTISKTLTLDLNGTTYTQTTDYDAIVFGGAAGTAADALPTLTITDSQGTGALVDGADKNGGSDTVYFANAGGKLIIDESATLKGLILISQAKNGATVDIEVNGTIDARGITFNSTDKNGKTTTYQQAAIQGNGGITDSTKATNIVIGSTGKVYAGNTAIYHPEKGTLTVAGLVEGGQSGIALKSGTLNVTETGTVSAVGAYTAPTQGWGNGVNSSGAAIQIESNAAYAGDIRLNVVPGATVKSTNGNAVYQYSSWDESKGKTQEDAEAKLASVNITGGTFTSGAGVEAIDVAETVKEKISVTGGKFSTDVSAYLAEGMKQSADGTVGADVIGKNDVASVLDAQGNLLNSYETLQAAINAAREGDTVTMLADSNEPILITTSGISLDGNKKFTINANGKDMNGANGHGLQVYCADNVTLKDVKITGAEKAGLLVNASSVKIYNTLTLSGNGWGGAINVGFGNNITDRTDGSSFDASFATLLDGVDKIYSDAGDITRADGKITITINSNQKWSRYVGTDGEIGYVLGAPVAQINGAGYTTLQGAINAAGEAQTTITLVDNTTENVTVAAGQSITLDLNGKTLNGDLNAQPKAGTVLTNNGTLTIRDGSSEGTGTITRSEGDAGMVGTGHTGHDYIILNNGTLTIESGTIASQCSREGNPPSAIANGTKDTGAKLIISGGSVTHTSGIAVKNDEYGTFKMTGGQVKTDAPNFAALLNWKDAAISGGKLSGVTAVQTMTYNSTTAETKLSGTVEVNGRLMVKKENEATTENEPKVSVSGGTFSEPIPLAFCHFTDTAVWLPVDNGDDTYGVLQQLPSLNVEGVEIVDGVLTLVGGGNVTPIVGPANLTTQVDVVCQKGGEGAPLQKNEDGTYTLPNETALYVFHFTMNGIFNYCDVNVVATSVSLSAESVVLKEDDGTWLKADVTPEGTAVEWSSSDESVARFADGMIIAVGAGTATITATVNGASAKCAVTVDHAYASDYEPTWTWSDDNATAVATFTCVANHAQTVEANVASGISREATCEQSELTRYTATVTFNDNTYTATKEVETAEANGHSFAETWASDGTNHWHKCGNCDATDAVAAHNWNAGEVTTAAQVGVPGVRTYTCTVCSVTRTETIPALTGGNTGNTGDSGNSGNSGTPSGPSTPSTPSTPVVTPPAEEDPAEEEPGESEDLTETDTPLVSRPFLFTDVSEKAWYHDSVKAMYDKGLINGVTETTFAPNATSTRAMVATLLYRLAGTPDVTGLDVEITDVGAKSWYHDAAVWAYSTGVFSGYKDGSFQGNGAITREQLAAVLNRYAVAMGIEIEVTVELDSFADAGQVSKWAVENMKWAVAAGLINGRGDKLAAKETATRAELATLLVRFDALLAAYAQNTESAENTQAAE